MTENLREVTLEAATDDERRGHPKCTLAECKNPATVKLCFTSAGAAIPPGTYAVFICELCAAEIEAMAATN